MSWDVHVATGGPGAKSSLAVQLVGGGPGAVVEADVSKWSRCGEKAVDQRPQRREADAAGDDDDVAPDGALDRPAVAERTAQADLVAPARRPIIAGGRRAGGRGWSARCRRAGSG